MHTNKTTEIATRKAKARIMALVLGLPSRPSRTMDTPANIKAASTATSANPIMYFMGHDYRPLRSTRTARAEMTRGAARA
jgi:hypothetical protein